MAAAWTEDGCDDLKPICLRVVARTYEVRTPLVDVAIASEKLAWRKMEQAEASLKKF